MNAYESDEEFIERTLKSLEELLKNTPIKRICSECGNIMYLNALQVECPVCGMKTKIDLILH